MGVAQPEALGLTLFFTHYVAAGWGGALEGLQGVARASPPYCGSLSPQGGLG